VRRRTRVRRRSSIHRPDRSSSGGNKADRSTWDTHLDARLSSFVSCESAYGVSFGAVLRIAPRLDLIEDQLCVYRRNDATTATAAAPVSIFTRATFLREGNAGRHRLPSYITGALLRELSVSKGHFYQRRLD